MPPHSDALVIGAGPVGSVTALALAQQGASVVLVESNPNRANRFAGEWIHPTGVAVLERLGLDLDGLFGQAPRGAGFVVCPPDGSAYIRLPYPEGDRGVSTHHFEIVSRLREQAIAHPLVDYRPHVRVISIDDDSVQLAPRHASHTTTHRAERIVGADGRFSLTRRMITGPLVGRVTSLFAGLELRGVRLPVDGYSHVFLGEPGPAFAYQLSDDCVRLCLDVPAAWSANRSDRTELLRLFAERLPVEWRAEFDQAIDEGHVAWAHTRRLPRVHYGSGRVALVGDAAGHFHPLTALGMTLGFLDGECLAAHPRLEDFRRQREAECYVADLLTDALYQMFTAPGSHVDALRAGLFRAWRGNPLHRLRTVGVLSGRDHRSATFFASFLRVGYEAAVSLLGRKYENKLSWPELVCDLGQLATWMRWPVASVAPQALRRYFDHDWLPPESELEAEPQPSRSLSWQPAMAEPVVKDGKG